MMKLCKQLTVTWEHLNDQLNRTNIKMWASANQFNSVPSFLSLRASVSFSVYLFVRLSVGLSVCLSACLFVC